MKEQQEIASFFQMLDFLIAAAESKLGTLRDLKQSYMQKMFI